MSLKKKKRAVAHVLTKKLSHIHVYIKNKKILKIRLETMVFFSLIKFGHIYRNYIVCSAVYLYFFLFLYFYLALFHYFELLCLMIKKKK